MKKAEGKLSGANSEIEQLKQSLSKEAEYKANSL